MEALTLKELREQLDLRLDNSLKHIFAETSCYIGKLLKAKNELYGDSFEKLRDEFPEYLAMRLTDKLNRLKVQIKKNVDITDTLLDIAGYCVLELAYRLKEDLNAYPNRTESTETEGNTE